MLSPITFNFDGSDPDHPAVYIGQTWNPVIFLYNDQAQTEPFDLTGYSGSLVVTGIATLVSGTPGLTLGGEFGSVAPVIDDDTTALQIAGTQSHYYLLLVDPDDNAGFAMRGTLSWAAP